MRALSGLELGSLFLGIILGALGLNLLIVHEGAWYVHLINGLMGGVAVATLQFIKGRRDV